MSQLRTRLVLPTPTTAYERALDTSLLSAWRELAQILNKGMEFSDQLNAQELTVTSDAMADTEFSAAHTLKRIPTRFVVVSQDKAGVVYLGGTAWTTSLAYFKCSVASVALKLLVY